MRMDERRTGTLSVMVNDVDGANGALCHQFAIAFLIRINHLREFLGPQKREVPFGMARNDDFMMTKSAHRKIGTLGKIVWWRIRRKRGIFVRKNTCRPLSRSITIDQRVFLF